MTNRILVGLATLLAIVMGVAPNVDAGAGGMLSLALVVLGLLYGAMAVEDTHSFGVTAIAVYLAAGSDVLNHVPAVGGQLDAIVGHGSTVLLAGVIAIFAMSTLNKLKG